MKDDIQPGKRRFRPRPRHIAILFVSIAAGSVGVYFLLTGNDTAPRLAALRAAGYPTTFAELAEYTKLPDGVPNAADVYMRAFAAFVPPVDELNTPLLGKAKLPDRGQPLPAPMAKAITDCLASNQQGLALLHKAAAIEPCRYEWDYADALIRWIPMKTQPHEEGIRHAASLLHLSVIAHAGEGSAGHRALPTGQGRAAGPIGGVGA
jgi:hypothetical protein